MNQVFFNTAGTYLPLNPPFKQGSYFDWFPFLKTEQGCAILFFANRLYSDGQYTRKCIKHFVTI